MKATPTASKRSNGAKRPTVGPAKKLGHSRAIRRPSFVAGVGSLLDLSGKVAASELSPKRVTPQSPEQAIAQAWQSVGQSLRAVLPPDDH